MLIAGALTSILGLVVARWGIRAMKDPNRPRERDGSFRVFWGTAVSMFGAGAFLVAAVDLVLER
jgi:hypothetical protein